MLLLCILAALRVSAGLHGDQQVNTDLSGSVLLLENRIVSNEPGSGRNVLSMGEYLFWKECSQGLPQRIMSQTEGEIYSREFFSGPFSIGNNLMVSIPEEILILDKSGTSLCSYFTGEYPGSLCSDGEIIWFVSSRDGVLKFLATDSGLIQSLPLPFCPSTVQFRNDLLLIGNADGGYSVCSRTGTEIWQIPDGTSGHFIDDSTIIFIRNIETEGCEILSRETVSFDVRTGKETISQISESPSEPVNRAVTDDPAAHFDVPYMHQKWDTPDWFNGSWSCGPTSCMMAVQYYNRLTPDSIWCSYPDGHWSEWGNYIPSEYTFLGETYDILGISPSSVWVPGAHGYICRDAGGAYWSYMAIWMQQHGLDSSWLGTTWGACTSELNNSWPVVASTQSIYTGGHILLFNGYYDNHSVVSNDSYGNQNVSGWGTLPNGKDVVYDWPGYNNGNVQLVISQLFSARSEVLSEAGTLIDDRSLGYRKLGPCQFWHEQETGYDGYSWWTYSTAASPDTCLVEWIPDLPSQNLYQIETYIPSSHSTATGIYHVYTTSGWETATVNQSNYSNQWASVGTFSLAPSTAYVRMGDYTGTQGQYISFDAVRFTLQTSVDNSNSSCTSSGFGVLLNPVSSSSTLTFTLPDSFNGAVQIFDLSGRLTLACQASIPAGSLSPGIYHAVINIGNGNESIRFTVTR